MIKGLTIWHINVINYRTPHLAIVFTDFQLFGDSFWKCDFFPVKLPNVKYTFKKSKYSSHFLFKTLCSSDDFSLFKINKLIGILDSKVWFQCNSPPLPMATLQRITSPWCLFYFIPWLQWFEPCVSFYYYVAWKETRWYHGIKQIFPAYNRVIVKKYHLVKFWLIHFTRLSPRKMEKSKLDLVIYFVLYNA